MASRVLAAAVPGGEIAEGKGSVLTPPSLRVEYVDEIDEHHSILIYGEPGAGKTYLAATAPDPIILLTESRVSRVTLRAVSRDLGLRPAVVHIRSTRDLEEAYGALLKDRGSFRTVVIDSLTELQELMLAEIVREAYAESLGRDREPHDVEKAEIGDWDRLGIRLRKVLRAFRDLPMHFVATALVQDVKQETRRIPLVQPQKQALRLPAFFTCVGYLEAREIDNEGTRVRILHLDSGACLAKNPGGALPKRVERPRLDEMIAKIDESLSKGGE